MPATDETPAVEQWSVEDLERLDRCPACGSGRTARYADGCVDWMNPTGTRWSLDRCGDCTSVFLNPRPTPSAIGRVYRSGYFTHGAPDDSWPATRGAALRERLLKGYVNVRYGYAFEKGTPVGHRVVPLIPGARGMANHFVRGLDAPAAGGRMLDIGCGNGAFLLRMRGMGWDVEGIEPDPTARSFARAAGVPVSGDPLTRTSHPPGSFDAVTMNHVIEHLHDPVEILRACHTILKPGGTVWISTPNAGSDGHEHFGRYWAQLDVPRHLVVFTYDALRRALAEAGFERIEDGPPTLVATRWTYRVSAAFQRGDDDPFAAPLGRGLAPAAVRADVHTMARGRHGEELIVSARKRG